jgi:hypothetical protein
MPRRNSLRAIANGLTRSLRPCRKRRRSNPGSTAVPPIDKVDLAHLKNLVLPDPEHPARNLWPPPQPSLAEQYAASMGAPAHPGADWAEWQRRRAEAVRAEQERLARYYEQAGRQQEARQNAEERARFGRQA